jgi:hypothetical protein
MRGKDTEMQEKRFLDFIDAFCAHPRNPFQTLPEMYWDRHASRYKRITI